MTLLPAVAHMNSDSLSPDRGSPQPQALSSSLRIITKFHDRPQIYLPDQPLVTGGTRGNYIFEHHRVAPGQLPEHVFEQHMFMLPLGTSAVPFYSRLNGRKVNGSFVPERLRFLAAGDHLSTTWGEPTESILVAIHPDVIHRALGEEADSATSDLISNIQAHHDPLLTHLIRTMECYLVSGRWAGKLFEQSLLATIAAHLVVAYGNGRSRNSRRTALTHWKQKQVENYVRENLGRNIGLYEIALNVNLSPCYLSRSFRATTGQGLWQFVLECRVREAMRLIRNGRSPSLECVARASGFQSYSQFITAFRRYLGQLPSEYRAAHGKSRQ